MAEGKKLTGAGLRGQSAGQTALCTVGKTGTGLTYRGYDISELAAGATFEEVAYLILYGELPNKKQLDAYKAKLKKLRVLPKSVKDVLERIPKTTHPMDVMRTGCSFLGNVEPEADFSQQLEAWAESIKALPWVASAATQNHTARVVVKDLGTAKRELIASALQAGLVLTRYEVVRPSLEDVFMQLVGKGGD